MQRQLADLVEEDGSAVCALEDTGPVTVGAGERAFDVAEQLRLDEILGDGGAVEDLERLAGARAVLVEDVGHQVLAGAGLTDDDHRQLRVGHALDGGVDLTHPGGRADQGTHVVDGRQVDGRGFTERLEADLGTAESKAGRRGQVEAADAMRADERAIGRFEIDEEEPTLLVVDARVKAGHGAIGDHEIIGACRPDLHLRLSKRLTVAAVGPLAHLEDEAIEYQLRSLGRDAHQLGRWGIGHRWQPIRHWRGRPMPR